MDWCDRFGEFSLGLQHGIEDLRGEVSVFVAEIWISSKALMAFLMVSLQTLDVGVRVCRDGAFFAAMKKEKKREANGQARVHSLPFNRLRFAIHPSAPVLRSKPCREVRVLGHDHIPILFFNFNNSSLISMASVSGDCLARCWGSYKVFYCWDSNGNGFGHTRIWGRWNSTYSL